MLIKSAGVAWILGALLCAGCAETPRLAITKAGNLPITAASYSLVEGIDTPASVALSACLAARGMTVSAKPTYLAQLIETDRPGGVGVMSSRSVAGTTPKDGTWLPGAAPDRLAVRSLTFSLILASTGQETYRIAVSERYRQQRKDSAPADLAQVACSNLAGAGVAAAK